MTPVNLVSFLVALAIVDMRYWRKRPHNHAEGPGRSPRWLPVSFRPSSQLSPDAADQETRHYHSYQRQLMRMEADEAFELRGVVVVSLALVLAGTTWAVWYFGGQIFCHFSTRQEGASVASKWRGLQT
ncbi:hypothetical protein HIM_09413 [Hirsutella minnesotensis 3608]|uniref:Copper transporter n=1 Tax=Hirsutella minnesotensis 3608 TaxID=1043627 RepID=A0A0F7ZXS0_9HYPO|nr:hypothetical protein HIM_09413 [Hirsutella minnesotensis 3608]